jgi:hypothetical protein
MANPRLTYAPNQTGGRKRDPFGSPVPDTHLGLDGKPVNDTPDWTSSFPTLPNGQVRPAKPVPETIGKSFVSGAINTVARPGIDMMPGQQSSAPSGVVAPGNQPVSPVTGKPILAQTYANTDNGTTQGANGTRIAPNGAGFARFVPRGSALASTGRVFDDGKDVTGQTMANVAASNNPEPVAGPARPTLDSDTQSKIAWQYPDTIGKAGTPENKAFVSAYASGPQTPGAAHQIADSMYKAPTPTTPLTGEQRQALAPTIPTDPTLAARQEKEGAFGSYPNAMLTNTAKPLVPTGYASGKTVNDLGSAIGSTVSDVGSTINSNIINPIANVGRGILGKPATDPSVYQPKSAVQTGPNQNFSGLAGMFPSPSSTQGGLAATSDLADEEKRKKKGMPLASSQPAGFPFK